MQQASTDRVGRELQIDQLGLGDGDETRDQRAHRIDQTTSHSGRGRQNTESPRMPLRPARAPPDPAGMPLPMCRRRGRQGRQRANNAWRNTRQARVCFFRRMELDVLRLPLHYRYRWLVASAVADHTRGLLLACVRVCTAQWQSSD